MDLVQRVVSDDVVSHPGAETCSSLMLVINIMLLYLVALVVDTLRAFRRWFIIILIFATICNWRAGIAQSLQGLITRWNIRGSNSDEGHVLRTRPERPWGPNGLLYNGQRVFPGDKTTGRGIDLTLRPRQRLKNEHKYNTTRNLGFRGLLCGEFAIRR